ncbi:hypothetical protein [Streptomyces sp. NBC_01549]|uniref:hypothetical protein n=1 Tax=Streptomyces sp. NBC_01549 TaxID=2975874 RepID=UPI002B1CDB9C|nr:hypothetical protein [Streptomyces sp. NBC_01549]
MAVLAGTEQAALAVDQWTGGSSAADAPDQPWGSASGRKHTASADATDATAKGGHDGPLTGRGELPADDASGVTQLNGTKKLPEPGPVQKTEAPDAAIVQGFDSKRSKEINGKRKEQQRTFQNLDGSYTTRFYTEPVNFRAKDGSWKAIDTTLVRQDTSGARTMGVDEPGWETHSTESSVEFAGSADADPVVRMQVGEGLSVGYAVEDASASPGQADGSVLTYSGLRTSSDLEFIVGGESVKETLVLKDRDAPTEWRFPLDLQGLTAAIDEHGNVVFTDADGKERAWTPAGWMEDSHRAQDSNEGAISSGVTYSLAEDEGRQVLVVKLDKDWLTAPERVFPVRVDPSVKSFDSTSGTYVESPYL